MRKLEEHQWEIEFNGGSFTLRCLDPCGDVPDHSENCPHHVEINSFSLDPFSLDPCSDDCPLKDFQFCSCQDSEWVEEYIEGTMKVKLKYVYEPGSWEYPLDTSSWFEVEPA